MSRLSLITRFIKLTFFFAVVCGLLGGLIVQSPKGIALGVALGLLLEALGFSISAPLLVRTLGPWLSLPAGLDKSMARVMAGFEGPAPGLAVFSSPYANVMMVRGATGSATVLLSQNLIAVLSEQELRALLHLCVHWSRERGLALRTVCAALAMGVLASAPRAWVNLVFLGRAPAHSNLTPFEALAFLTALPYARFFLRLSRRNPNDGGTGGAESREVARWPDSAEWPEWKATAISAMRKITLPTETVAPVRNPGAAYLFAFNPWARKALLPE